jgi:glucose/arabinose dehydrogenase
MKSRFLVLCIALCGFALSSFAQIDVNITLVQFATGFDKPIGLEHAGDERLFVIEKDGVIRILMPNGSINSTPFLDMQTLTSTGGVNSEQGLLGLTFHPDYTTNGYFYVNYTMVNGDTRISRFTVSANPDVADATSRLDILTVDQPYGNHNGGCLKFGPDGYLYIGMGDGGSGEDPLNNGQSMDELLGKILRIDVNVGALYGIPADNPFIGASTDTLPEIWASGIRNPWRNR